MKTLDCMHYKVKTVITIYNRFEENYVPHTLTHSLLFPPNIDFYVSSAFSFPRSLTSVSDGHHVR